MKCLANSNASFAIVDKPSLTYAFHHTPNSSSFSLRSWNHNVVGNFRSLKLEHNSNIFPVRASETEIQTKVELDTAEHTEDLQVQQKDESKLVRVKFQLQRECKFGEQFFIAGDDPMFGSWDPSDAKPMAWSDGHVWTAEMDIAAEKTVQFKFILKGRKGNITWQPGSDRMIKPWESVDGITVCEDWENAELQKIMGEQEQVSNEELDMEKPLMSSSSDSISCHGDGSNGTVASINNQERKVAAERNLHDSEESDSVEEF